MSDAKEKTGVIYALLAPKTKKVVYIGCTTRPVETRLAMHKAACMREEFPISKWLRKIRESGKWDEIGITILKSDIPQSEISKEERAHIVMFVNSGIKLLNVNSAREEVVIVRDKGNVNKYGLYNRRQAENLYPEEIGQEISKNFKTHEALISYQVAARGYAKRRGWKFEQRKDGDKNVIKRIK